MLELKNINISYDKKECVRNGMFRAIPGNITGIYGESGTGKSSLLYVIGMLSTKQCEYYYNNELIEYDEKQKAKFRNEHISFITQNSVMIETISVEKNIEFFLTMSDADYKVDELLQLVNLTDKKKAMPNSLSGGERQRAAIACAIAKDSDIILGDELTSALDEDNKQAVMNLLRECADKGKIVILVSHEKKVLDECDVLYKIDHLQLIKEKEFVCNKIPIRKNRTSLNENVLKIYEVLFCSSRRYNKYRYITSIIFMVFFVIISSFFIEGLKSIESSHLSVDDVNKNKILILNDESNFYHTVKYGFGLRTLEYYEPFYEEFENKLSNVHEIETMYDYHVFNYQSYNRFGTFSTMEISATRNSQNIAKKVLNEEYEMQSYSFSVLPFFDEEDYVSSKEGVYINDNMAFVYNLQAGDELVLELNVPFVMMKSTSLVKESMVNPLGEEVEGTPYYKVNCLSEKVEYTTKVLGIIESNSSFSNEIYMYNQEMERLIDNSVERYKQAIIKVSEEEFLPFHEIIDLTSYAKVCFVDSFESVLKVQNEINMISDKVFTYNEYQNVMSLMEESKELGMTSFMITCIVILLFMIGGSLIYVFYTKKYTSIYMMLNLLGYESRDKNKIYMIETFHFIIIVLFLSIFVYLIASLPDILLMLDVLTVEKVYSYMNEFTNIIYAYFRFTPIHFAILVFSVVMTVSISHYMIVNYYNKKDITKWLRGE